MGILGSLSTRPSLARSTPRALSRRQLSFEQLETRLVPSASGNAWRTESMSGATFTGRFWTISSGSKVTARNSGW